ncbi:MAG: hypothetical protein Q4D61_07790 [Cardiobacteriaceae bacterium]|nr:hypothetical protein [Cardiobacteriaceae bacterium]
MNPTALDPLVSEFASAEEERDYLRWLQAKVDASQNDPRPSVPHDEAMAQVAQALRERRKQRADG